MSKEILKNEVITVAYNDRLHECLSTALKPLGFLVTRFEDSELSKQDESKVKYSVTKGDEMWAFASLNEMTKEMQEYGDVETAIYDLWADLDADDRRGWGDYNNWLKENDYATEEALVNCGYKVVKL